MKKIIITISIIASLWLIETLFHISQALLLFITIGVIPGTNTSLSANSMLLITTTTGIGVIASLIFSHSYTYLIVRYHVRHFFVRAHVQLQLATKLLGHWYHSVQSTPAKVASPEE